MSVTVTTVQNDSSACAPRPISVSSSVCAVLFWTAVFLATVLLAIGLVTVFVVALVLEPFLQLRGDSRVCHSDILFDLDATEDKLLPCVCTSPSVKHVWKEIAVLHNEIEYICRGHALFVPNKAYSVSNNTATVVLLHGNAASAFCFAELFDGLAETYNVLAIDLPGFGRSRSPRPPDHTAVEFFSQFIAAFLDEMALESVYVVAHSFGGYVASDLAFRKPKLVRRLMLLDAAGVFPMLGSTGAFWAFFFKFSLFQFHRNFGALGRRAFFNLFHVAGSSLAVYYWYAVTGDPDSWGDRAMAENIALSWNRAFWRDPVLPTLAALQTPIATGYGAKDTIMPAHQGDALERMFGWPTRCFMNSGHVPLHGKDAGEVVDYIRTFDGVLQLPREFKLIDVQSLALFESCFSISETRQTIHNMYAFLGAVDPQTH
jgi:pimeloyl-ACP methyl ester carboxylesterase